MKILDGMSPALTVTLGCAMPTVLKVRPCRSVSDMVLRFSPVAEAKVKEPPLERQKTPSAGVSGVSMPEYFFITVR